MTKSLRKNVQEMGIELGAACMPRGHASDQATTPGRAAQITGLQISPQTTSGPLTWFEF